jgi:uncharacterized protein (TIGR00730 family)
MDQINIFLGYTNLKFPMEMQPMKAVCVYCGSSDDVHEDYLEAAFQMGLTLARRGLRLIYGGVKTGLRGRVADGARAGGGEPGGAIVTSMNTPSLAHPGLTRLEVTDTIHERKARMYELSNGYIALPGGYGTMDELFETLTWAQIGEHCKPVGLLNIRDYYKTLLNFIEHAEKEKFIFPEHRQSLMCASTPDELLDALQKHIHPAEAVKRWMRQE